MHDTTVILHLFTDSSKILSPLQVEVARCVSYTVYTAFLYELRKLSALASIALSVTLHGACSTRSIEY